MGKVAMGQDLFFEYLSFPTVGILPSVLRSGVPRNNFRGGGGVNKFS